MTWYFNPRYVNTIICVNTDVYRSLEGPFVCCYTTVLIFSSHRECLRVLGWSCPPSGPPVADHNPCFCRLLSAGHLAEETILSNQLCKWQYPVSVNIM